MIDVAKKAGVSKSTVSLVLANSSSVSQDKIQRVNKAISELGYVYNRGAAGLRGGRSNMVAILSNNLTSPYFNQVISGLEPYLDELGLMPIIMDINESLERQSRMVDSLREYNIAAVIITPAPGTKKKWIDDLVNSGLPIISIMREVDNAISPVVMLITAWAHTSPPVLLSNLVTARLVSPEALKDFLTASSVVAVLWTP